MPVSRHTDLSLSYLLVTSRAIGEEERVPLVLVMHGRGADANDLSDITPALDGGGWRFVFPNAPRAFEPVPGMSFGFSWFDGWPPQGTSFHESRRILLRFMDEALERYPASRIVISGFSQGGMMALDLGFRLEQPVSGIVCMSGALNENDPPPFREHPERPVLIVHGSADEMIPVLAARRTRLVFENHGLEPEYHEFPMGHQLTEESVETVAAFMKRVAG